MAHMIDSIAWAHRTPWHGLGQKMSDAERTDLAAAIVAAKLGWDVDTRPLYYDLAGDGGRRSVPDAKGMYRTDTGAYLGTVGAAYTPIQHRGADGQFEIAAPLIAEGYTVEVMAALDGGRRVFALLRMPNGAETIADGDDVNGYLLLLTHHDGSGAARAMLTPIRVVCQNTLTAALNADTTTAVSIRHTRSAPDRIKEAHAIMRKMSAAMKASGDTFRALAGKRMGPAELAAYIETIVPNTATAKDEPLSELLKARRAAIADLIFHGAGQAGEVAARTGQATAWHAFNAVTEYFDHIRPREAKSAAGATKAAESSLFGTNARLKATALRALVAA